MKIAAFHLMPYRDLAPDFEKKYKSAWFDLPFREVADPNLCAQYYNWTLDELTFCAESGFDGVCTNEHHQNAYGFMVNPNMMGAVLARATRGSDTAIIQLGSTAVFQNPPIRVAEEYAMLDCISEGRVVAGFPVGLGGDFAYSYGMAPMTQRGRYREAHDLIKKAWTADEIFAWNGKYYQLPMVNIWPRPVQQPHPPIWVPGNASPSTWDFVINNDYSYCYLTYFGAKGATHMVEGYWNRVEELGRDRNPYRMGFLVPVGVSETDEQAEAEFGRHIEYFYHKGLRLPEQYLLPPGHMTHSSLTHLLTKRPFPPYEDLQKMRFRHFDENDFLVAGSAATVVDRLLHIIKTLNVGHLMILPQYGSMSHEQTMENIERIAKGVLPHLRNVWDGAGWEDHWWPQTREKAQRAAA
ncbi:MAG: LLM class flavin-dependent oxidoreductase [Gammaproteobacteria bacterium]|nr:LLM class flavin-dependent oxidoreductase [Gammaproteobacteria bacterium]